MKTYETPVYPALMVRLPPDHKSVKAMGGKFRIADEDVEAFEKFIAARPLYRIREIEADAHEHGEITETGAHVGDTPPAATPESAGAVSADADNQVVQTDQAGVTPRVELTGEFADRAAVEELNVDQLKAKLEERGLDAKGHKADLVDRLAENLGL